MTSGSLKGQSAVKRIIVVAPVSCAAPSKRLSTSPSEPLKRLMFPFLANFSISSSAGFVDVATTIFSTCLDRATRSN